MSENEQEPKSKKDTRSYDADQLQAIVSTAMAAALKAAAEQTAEGNKALADAILKAREPYVSPKDKANNESMRRSMRIERERQQATFKANQDACIHKKGSNALSWYPNPNDSAFIIHDLDSGETIMCCSNCTKICSSLNPEDSKYFADARGTNIRSSAGRRTFADPLKVQRARLGLDQKEIFVEEDEKVAAS